MTLHPAVSRPLPTYSIVIETDAHIMADESAKESSAGKPVADVIHDAPDPDEDDLDDLDGMLQHDILHRQSMC